VSAGKLSSTGSEIRVAWEMVLGTIIKDVEGLIMDKIKQIVFEQTSINIDDLLVMYEPPVSFMSDITPSQVLTINEQREVLGFDPLEDGDTVIKKEVSPTNKI